jgi:CRP-like cAMP-binding protein
MNKALRTPVENLLLASLPHAEYESLLPDLELVHLSKRKILYNQGDRIHTAYFPLNGVISLLATTTDGEIVEVALQGNEGMVGLPILFKVGITPYQIQVQIPGVAARLSANVIKREFLKGAHFQSMMLRHTHALLSHISQSAVCNRFHTLEARLCRWLLITRDRINSDTIDYTQEFLAHMLGCPRTGVTMVASTLQKAKLIGYARGRIDLLDVPALEAISCECYKIIKHEIEASLAA